MDSPKNNKKEYCIVNILFYLILILIILFVLSNLYKRNQCENFEDTSTTPGSNGIVSESESESESVSESESDILNISGSQTNQATTMPGSNGTGTFSLSGSQTNQATTMPGSNGTGTLNITGNTSNSITGNINTNAQSSDQIRDAIENNQNNPGKTSNDLLNTNSESTVNLDVGGIININDMAK